MNPEIDNYPVSDLPSRFNVGKQALYNRLDSIGIKPTKVGKRSYITTEQLQALDKLHEHLIEGGTMVQFQDPIELTSPLATLDKSTGLSEDNLELLVRVVSAAVASTVPTPSPLWYLSELKKAQVEGWLLTTSEVQKLIGVKPKLAKGASTYQRGSFSFAKAGKVGTQTAWLVLGARG